MGRWVHGLVNEMKSGQSMLSLTTIQSRVDLKYVVGGISMNQAS